jgi:hypothetical protein
MSVSCEKVTFEIAEPLIGPFAKISFTASGDVTVMAGVKAGGESPISAGDASAGVYVTVHGDTITDVGVTASVSEYLKAGPIQIAGPSASVSVTAADVYSGVSALIAPPGELAGVARGARSQDCGDRAPRSFRGRRTPENPP